MVKKKKKGLEINLKTYKSFLRTNKEALKIMYLEDSAEEFEEYCMTLWSRMNAENKGVYRIGMKEYKVKDNV